MGIFQRIADQITAPAFAQMQDQIRAMTYAPVIDSIATPALGQMREQIHAMAYSPAMDSITAAMLPDAAWMAPYLRTVDTVALFDNVYSVQSPITNMLDQMSESVRSQFLVSGAMTDTLVTSQFERMMDSIEDIASPAKWTSSATRSSHRMWRRFSTTSSTPSTRT